MRQNILDDAANTGGHPFTIDDLQVLGYQCQDISEALKTLAMYSQTNGANLVAGGSTFTDNGTDYATAAGWIWYNNQLWQLQAKATTARPVGHLVYIEFNQTPIKPTKLYQNSTTKQVAVRNEAKLITAASQPANTVLFSTLHRNNIFTKLNELILSAQIADQRLDSVEAAWQTANLSTLVVGSPTFDAANSYYRFKVIGKTIFIQCVVSLTSAETTFSTNLPNSLQWKHERNPRVPSYAFNSSYCNTRGSGVLSLNRLITDLGTSPVDGFVEITYTGEIL